VSPFDPVQTVRNDRSRDYQLNGSAHLEHFSFTTQSSTSGAGFPPHTTTLVPQWGHRIRPARKNATPISNNGAGLRAAHSGGTTRSSKANSGNMAATIRNANSDFFFGLTVRIEATVFHWITDSISQFPDSTRRSLLRVVAIRWRAWSIRV
jgi:hypothetical protein